MQNSTPVTQDLSNYDAAKAKLNEAKLLLVKQVIGDIKVDSHNLFGDTYAVPGTLIRRLLSLEL